MEIDKSQCFLKTAKYQNFVSTLYTAITSVSKKSEIKKGSNLFICVINLEFHFIKFHHSVNSKTEKNHFQSNEQRFAATT